MRNAFLIGALITFTNLAALSAQTQAQPTPLPGTPGSPAQAQPTPLPGTPPTLSPGQAQPTPLQMTPPGAPTPLPTPGMPVTSPKYFTISGVRANVRSPSFLRSFGTR